MLLGSRSNRPNIDDVRKIKRALREALSLQEDVLITVTQLACLEEECAPLETVIGLLPRDGTQRQSKVHKATDEINAADLAKVCDAWGYSVAIEALETTLKEF